MNMALKEYQIRAKKNYNKKIKKVSFEINMETESELYDYLSKISNKSKFIKELIREQMQKEQ